MSIKYQADSGVEQRKVQEFLFIPFPEYIKLNKTINFNIFYWKRYISSFPIPLRNPFMNKEQYIIGMKTCGFIIKQDRVYFNKIDLQKFSIWYNLKV